MSASNIGSDAFISADPSVVTLIVPKVPSPQVVAKRSRRLAGREDAVAAWVRNIGDLLSSPSMSTTVTEVAGVAFWMNRYLRSLDVQISDR